VADLSNKKRIAQLFRLLGSTGGERRNAFAALERLMQSEGIGWSDIGNTIECNDERSSSKYTEAEMLEFAQAARAEGVEAGIRIGVARAANGGGKNQLTLPLPAEMAEYCHERARQLKDDDQRKFISEMLVTTRHCRRPPPGPLGYLASLYIKHGGKI
jgi:hypothetical protein